MPIPTTIQSFFQYGMKRSMNEVLYPYDNQIVLELGPGASKLPRADHTLEYPLWDADQDPLPFPDESLDFIYASHFLEHCASPIKVLRECERVLLPGGVLTLVVPHAGNTLAFQDLDHKSFYVLDTWKTLFDNPYYEKGREVPWKLSVHINFMMAIVERNTAIFTQLVKEDS